MKKIIVSLVVLLTLSFGNTIDEAKAYYEKKDYVSAFNIFEKLASNNDMVAQNFLGLMYRNGYGVQKDIQKAVELFKKSADQGNVNAQFALGSMYYDQKDYKKAAEWYKKAANQGNEAAQTILGLLHLKEEVEKEKKAARDSLDEESP